MPRIDFRKLGGEIKKTSFPAGISYMEASNTCSLDIWGGYLSGLSPVPPLLICSALRQKEDKLTGAKWKTPFKICL